MNILDKVGEGLATTVDVIVEKNRQLAQMNRLAAIIKTETDMINRAYIALGKQYFKMLQGNAEENDMSQVCEVIRFSEERLKKAQARYDYVKVYGVPASPVDSVEMIRNNEECEPAPAEETEDVSSAEEPDAEEESADITIAVADEETAAEKTDEQTAEKTDEQTDNEEPVEKTVAEKAAETVNQLKKRRSRKTADDTEAAND